MRQALAVAAASGLFATACGGVIGGGSDSAALEATSADAAPGTDETGASDTPGTTGAVQDVDIPPSRAVIEDPDFDYQAVNYDADPIDSALRGNRSNETFPPPLVDLNLIQGGGPPPDGIPAIDSPAFDSVSDVDFVDDNEAVLSLVVNGEARAYPIQVMIWHEIVNDEIGGIPISVTYCPLCNSALAYDRRFGNRTLDFGTSGELYQSAMVMYDRQTETLWSHFTGQGMAGHYAGAQLTLFPVQTVSFAEFKRAHPDGQVLNRDTGHRRRYGENPYVGYDDEASGPFRSFFNGEVDGRLLSKARVLGFEDDAGSLAIRLETLQQTGVVEVTEGGRNLVALHTTGLASALESGDISGGRDIGQTGLFVPEATDGAALTFTATANGTFRDDQTDSEWNILGTAISGDLEGQQLQGVPAVDTFWFAWATYRPETVIL